MSSGAGAGVTFAGAGVKKSDSDHLWCSVRVLILWTSCLFANKWIKWN